MVRFLRQFSIFIFYIFSLSIASSGEIAPGISVRDQRWHVPVNENPFFGFIEKNAKEKEADAKFMEFADKNKKDRYTAATELIDIAWREIKNNGDLGLASRRLNQAWLLDKDQSQIPHGFALISLFKFNDVSYALELMNASEKLKYRRDEFYKDYGWILNLNEKPKDAIPYLMHSIEIRPLWSLAYVELARSHVMLKEFEKACHFIRFIGNRSPELAPSILDALNKQAECK